MSFERENDIQKLCKGVLDDHSEIEDSDYSRNCGCPRCFFCLGYGIQNKNPKTIKHEHDCVVLIARDLSTREKEGVK